MTSIKQWLCGVLLTINILIAVPYSEAAASSTLDSGGPHNLKSAENPFARFFGEWGLKQDLWNQRHGDNPMQTITIANHRTRCFPLNTANSVLCMIESPGLDGHILWTLNTDSNAVSHLSNFTPSRNGVGQGYFDQQGNLFLKVTFQGEPDGTHRRYVYRWISDTEYTLESTQYRDDTPTSSFYGGTFVRLESAEDMNVTP